jgi:excisionase family DNA binding protein
MRIDDKLLCVAEVAEMLCIRPTTVYQWSYERRLRTVKLGRSLRFRQSDVETFIRSCERPALRGKQDER